jgi:hypothetical protein
MLEKVNIFFFYFRVGSGRLKADLGGAYARFPRYRAPYCLIVASQAAFFLPWLRSSPFGKPGWKEFCSSGQFPSHGIN